MGIPLKVGRYILTFKYSPEGNSPVFLILLQWVLFRGSHLLQILLKALMKWLLHVLSSSGNILLLFN